MLRRISAPAVARSAVAAAAARNYNFGPFKNADRKPQLTEEERAAVKINYDEWPAEFQNYDPQDPYKASPDFIEGMSTWNYWLWGLEVAFIYQFYELVFPSSI